MKLKWVGKKIAMKWKAGCIVLIHSIGKNRSGLDPYEVKHYFRPDWINDPIGYGTGKQRYLKLSSTIKKI